MAKFTTTVGMGNRITIDRNIARRLRIKKKDLVECDIRKVKRGE